MSCTIRSHTKVVLFKINHPKTPMTSNSIIHFINDPTLTNFIQATSTLLIIVILLILIALGIVLHTLMAVCPPFKRFINRYG